MKSKTAISQLKNVWSKVGLDDVPTPDQVRDNLQSSGKVATRKKSDRTSQMNLRIRPEEKQRVELIAVREAVSINEVFSRMLELYEREHGRAELAPGKIRTDKK
jgi:hypothetical protein